MIIISSSPSRFIFQLRETTVRPFVETATRLEINIGSTIDFLVNCNLHQRFSPPDHRFPRADNFDNVLLPRSFSFSQNVVQVNLRPICIIDWKDELQGSEIKSVLPLLP